MIWQALPVKSRYLPILKVKQAELEALKELPRATRQELTPVMEFRAEAGAEDWTKRLASHWGEAAPIFVDVVAARRGGGLAQASNVLARIIEYSRLKGLFVIPVTGLAKPAQYQEVVVDAARKDHRGVLIRLSPADSERETDLKGLVSEINNVTTNLGVMLDFGAIGPDAATQTAHAVRSLLPALIAVTAWRLVAVAATSFPQRLGELRRVDLGIGITRAAVNRAEWMAWRKLADKPGDLSVVPTFSDYTVQHPTETEIDARTIPRVPNIRYALDEGWAIYLGKDLNKVDTPTFGDLCQALTGTDGFGGGSHCAGDKFLGQCARGEVRPMPASYPAWRRPCFTHHMTRVVNQLTN